MIRSPLLALALGVAVAGCGASSAGIAPAGAALANAKPAALEYTYSGGGGTGKTSFTYDSASVSCTGTEKMTVPLISIGAAKDGTIEPKWSGVVSIVVTILTSKPAGKFCPGASSAYQATGGHITNTGVATDYAPLAHGTYKLSGTAALRGNICHAELDINDVKGTKGDIVFTMKAAQISGIKFTNSNAPGFKPC